MPISQATTLTNTSTAYDGSRFLKYVNIDTQSLFVAQLQLLSRHIKPRHHFPAQERRTHLPQGYLGNSQ